MHGEEHNPSIVLVACSPFQSTLYFPSLKLISASSRVYERQISRNVIAIPRHLSPSHCMQLCSHASFLPTSCRRTNCLMAFQLSFIFPQSSNNLFLDTQSIMLPVNPIGTVPSRNTVIIEPHSIELQKLPTSSAIGFGLFIFN